MTHEAAMTTPIAPTTQPAPPLHPLVVKLFREFRDAAPSERMRAVQSNASVFPGGGDDPPMALWDGVRNYPTVAEAMRVALDYDGPAADLLRDSTTLVTMAQIAGFLGHAWGFMPDYAAMREVHGEGFADGDTYRMITPNAAKRLPSGPTRDHP